MIFSVKLKLRKDNYLNFETVSLFPYPTSLFFNKLLIFPNRKIFIKYFSTFKGKRTFQL